MLSKHKWNQKQKTCRKHWAGTSLSEQLMQTGHQQKSEKPHHHSLPPKPFKAVQILQYWAATQCARRGWRATDAVPEIHPCHAWNSSRMFEATRNAKATQSGTGCLGRQGTWRDKGESNQAPKNGSGKCIVRIYVRIYSGHQAHATYFFDLLSGLFRCVTTQIYIYTCMQYYVYKLWTCNVILEL